jgi:plastocyanin
MRGRIATALACVLLAAPGAAQVTLERTPLLDGGWTGVDRMLHVALPYRFVSGALPGFDAGLSLPGGWMVGARAAPGSRPASERADDWEVFGRVRPLSQWHGAPLDAAISAGYDGGGRGLAGELSLARWAGPLRALAVVRAFSEPLEGEARAFFGAGAVLHPRPGRLPLAFTGDLTLPLGPSDPTPAWSAGAQLGVSFTTHTIAVFVTNTTSPTTRGRSVGTDEVRIGAEVTLFVPAGRFFGMYASRERAARAVMATDHAAAVPGSSAARVVASRYLFGPQRVVIPAGGTVEWVNTDDVLHTATADDGAWSSGPIRPGQRWQATFMEPGIYPYICGPHPFMQGVVIVTEPRSDR